MGMDENCGALVVRDRSDVELTDTPLISFASIFQSRTLVCVVARMCPSTVDYSVHPSHPALSCPGEEACRWRDRNTPANEAPFSASHRPTNYATHFTPHSVACPAARASSFYAMPPRSAPKLQQQERKSGPTPQELAAIQEYLAQKPDFSKLLREAKGNPELQESKFTETEWEKKARENLKEGLLQLATWKGQKEEEAK